MKYTESEIRDVLMSQYAGLKAEQYGQAGPYSWYLTLRSSIKNLGYDEDFINKHIGYHQDRFSVDITYHADDKYPASILQNSRTILRIDGKRKKGETHRNWYGEYTDYVWKDFVVTLYTNTTEPTEANLQDWLIRLVNQAEESAKKKNDIVYEAYKVLRDAFPDMDEYSLNDIIERVKANRYTLGTRYEKEKKGEN